MRNATKLAVLYTLYWTWLVHCAFGARYLPDGRLHVRLSPFIFEFIRLRPVAAYNINGRLQCMQWIQIVLLSRIAWTKCVSSLTLCNECKATQATRLDGNFGSLRTHLIDVNLIRAICEMALPCLIDEPGTSTCRSFVECEYLSWAQRKQISLRILGLIYWH